MREAHGEALKQLHAQLAAAQTAAQEAAARADENASEAELAEGAAAALEDRVKQLEGALGASHGSDNGWIVHLARLPQATPCCRLNAWV